MARSIYTPEEIIEAGEALEKRNGTGVEPWQVFKAVGERGKFTRVQEIWEQHVAARNMTPSGHEGQLPSHVETELSKILEGAGGSVQRVLSTQIAQLTAEHVEQVRVMQRQHADEVAKVRSQLEYWRDRALESQQDDAVSPTNERRLGAAEPLVSPILHERPFPTRPMGPSCRLILPTGRNTSP